jgi:hypothetical protein
MVTFKHLSRFFTRNSSGKYQLDVREIRAAFTASGDLRARIAAFHTDRLGKIIANETPVSLPGTPKIILHLLPLTIIDPTIQIDFAPLLNDPNLYEPIKCHNYVQRFNIDGFLSHAAYGSGENNPAYLQVFRSGAIEAVNADLLDQGSVAKLVPSGSVESAVRDATRRYFGTMEKLGVSLPLILMVTMQGLKGYALATGSPFQDFRQAHRFDRDLLLLPDVLVEDFSTPADKLLKPIFDAFWQSAGLPSSQNYNKQGRWDGGLSQRA